VIGKGMSEVVGEQIFVENRTEAGGLWPKPQNGPMW
jgi:hypothetical protein